MIEDCLSIISSFIYIWGGFQNNTLKDILHTSIIHILNDTTFWDLNGKQKVADWLIWRDKKDAYFLWK